MNTNNQLPETEQSIKIKKLRARLSNDWKAKKLNQLVEEVWGDTLII